MKNTNLDVGYWSREITSIGAMTYCEGTSVESSLEPQGLRPDWEIMVYGAPSPPAWRGKTWWTMENNGDYSCEQRTDLQFPSPFCMAHLWADKNRHFLRQRNSTFWRVKFLGNYVSNHWWSLSLSSFQELQNRQNPVRWQYNSRNTFSQKESANSSDWYFQDHFVFKFLTCRE